MAINPNLISAAGNGQPSPFISNPTSSSVFGGSWNMNPTQFATQPTANTLGSAFGMPVTNAQPAYGPISYNSPQYMVGNANAGLLNDWISKNPGWQSSPFLTQTLMSMTGFGQPQVNNYTQNNPFAIPAGTPASAANANAYSPGMTRPGSAALPDASGRTTNGFGPFPPSTGNGVTSGVGPNPVFPPAATGTGAGGAVPFTPLANGASPSSLAAATQAQGGGSSSVPDLSSLLSLLFGSGIPGTLSPDQMLAQTARTGGMPMNAANAGLAMTAAQNDQIMQGLTDLRAQFASSGAIPQTSTDFGRSSQMYMNQAMLNQNSVLAQMSLPLMQQMSQQAYGATGQLSSQDFQSQMLQMQQAFGAAQGLTSLTGQGGLTAAQQLASQGVGGANQLQAGALTGMQDLFGASTNAATQNAQLQLQLQQLGLGAGFQNIGLGSQLGQQQFDMSQSGLNNLYQLWMQQQPQYNPLLNLMGGASMGYPSMGSQAFAPSSFTQWLNAASGIIGALP